MTDDCKHQLERTGFLKSLGKRQQWMVDVKVGFIFGFFFKFLIVICVENVVFKITADCFTARSAICHACGRIFSMHVLLIQFTTADQP